MHTEKMATAMKTIDAPIVTTAMMVDTMVVSLRVIVAKDLYAQIAVVNVWVAI